MKIWLSLCLLITFAEEAMSSTWAEWWTYQGISGPDFWGLVNPDWQLCAKGKCQSPIDIKPKQLLYDPHLKHVHVGKYRIAGTLVNTGHDVRVILDDPSAHHVNVSGGPFQYQYRISDIVLHFGSDNTMGSEHKIDGKHFPAEIHLIGWNSDISGNMSHALYSTHGLAIIALLVQVGSESNVELKQIAQNLKETRYKGEQVRIRHLSVHDMLPDTTEYMTYEGSLTQPGCQETVTWLIFNKPIYATNEDLILMRELMQGEESSPKGSMVNNNRPTMPLHHRPIRTNINFEKSSKACTMEKETNYQANVLENSENS